MIAFVVWCFLPSWVVFGVLFVACFVYGFGCCVELCVLFDFVVWCVFCLWCDLYMGLVVCMFVVLSCVCYLLFVV